MTTRPDPDTPVHPVDEILPAPRLFALGLQHVLVMYAGAVAVPLIIGRALKLSPEDVAFLISADLFCCGLVTLIQSLGATQWFGIRLPVMMGVTFAAVAPMVAMANANPGAAGAQLIFGSIIGAGVISILIAPVVSRMLRFFPPVVTGTIIAVIGISLMRIGINWIFGNPVGPTAPSIINPEHKQWLDAAAAAASAPVKLLGPVPMVDNPAYGALDNMAVAAFVLVTGLLGFSAWQASEYQGIQALRSDSAHRVDLFAAAVDGIVNRYAHIPATIQLNEDVLQLLRTPRSRPAVGSVNRFLQQLNSHVGSIAIFVLDERGIVLAASNWDHPDDSFVGEDLSFRNYFLTALSGRTGHHFAIGITRGEPGYFVSHPIRDGDRVVGVAVIKISLEQLDRAWHLLGVPALIADRNGVVILTPIPAWRYTALSPLPLDTRVEVKLSRLYNDAPIGAFPVPLPTRLDPAGQIVETGAHLGEPGHRAGLTARYLVHGRDLPDLGWRLLIFSDLRPVQTQALGHAALAAVATGFILLLLLVALRNDLVRYWL